MKKNDKWFGPVNPPFAFPFYYASLSSLTVFYRVEAKRLAAVSDRLKGAGLKAAKFGGQAAVSIEFQNYTGHGGQLLETVNEVEFNILAYPKSREHLVPRNLTLEEFVAGQDQTKIIGGYRVDVPADNAFAVWAGADAFGEQKFYTTFEYNIPSLNNPAQNPDTWEYTVHQPGFAGKPPAKPKDIIYGIRASLAGLTPNVSNPSPIPLYSVSDYQNKKCYNHPVGNPDDPNCRKNPVSCCLDRRRNQYAKGDKLIISYWNIWGPYHYYKAEKGSRMDVAFTLGKSKDRMKGDLEAILGGKPVADFARVFQSTPAATESRPVFVEV